MQFERSSITFICCRLVVQHAVARHTATLQQIDVNHSKCRPSCFLHRKFWRNTCRDARITLNTNTASITAVFKRVYTQMTDILNVGSFYV